MDPFLPPIATVLIGVAAVVAAILWLRWHAFLALALGAILVGTLSDPSTVAQTVTEGFGDSCRKIGFLIAFASIIGRCLLESGAAERIVRGALALFGEKRASWAFVASGFLLGIPVFFDTVFYLMVPLARVMAQRTGKNFLLYVLSITAGATMAHSLVPPTPGPVFVASELKIDLGVMMLAGLAVGLVTVTAGAIYTHVLCRRADVPLRENAEYPRERLVAIAARPTRELPGLFLSLAPIVLPVVLIAGRTIAKSLADANGWELHPVWGQLGDKNLALGVSALLSLAIWQRHRDPDNSVQSTLQQALESAGVIILITAAGGAFGKTLLETGIDETISQLSAGSQMALLPIAFLITTLVRTAQGSATVAMMTATGVLAGAIAATDLSYHPVYVALAIGSGSKPFSWMNDSGFWVVCKMSGMTESECLRYYTPLSAFMGFVGLGAVCLGAWWLPLV